MTGDKVTRLPTVSSRVPRRRARRRRLRRLCLIALLLILAAAYAERAALLPAVARLLDVSGPAMPSDYVMILGGGADTRPFLAAALYRRGLARAVLVPQVSPSPESEDGVAPNEHELIGRVLAHEGVPADAVVIIGEPCSSTEDE